MNAEDAPCTLSRSIGAASASRGGIAPPSSLDPDRGGSGLEPADDAARVAANRNRCVAALGLEPVGSSPAEMQATMERDIPKWAKVIEDAKITTSK